MRTNLASVGIKSSLAGIINPRRQPARDHARDQVEARTKRTLWIRHARFILACNRQNFIGTKLGIERGTSQKAFRARVIMHFSRPRSDRASFRPRVFLRS